jgi:hypothetical protein
VEESARCTSRGGATCHALRLKTKGAPLILRLLKPLAAAVSDKG